MMRYCKRAVKITRIQSVQVGVNLHTLHANNSIVVRLQITVEYAEGNWKKVNFHYFFAILRQDLTDEQYLLSVLIFSLSDTWYRGAGFVTHEDERIQNVMRMNRAVGGFDEDGNMVEDEEEDEEKDELHGLRAAEEQGNEDFEIPTDTTPLKRTGLYASAEGNGNAASKTTSSGSMFEVRSFFFFKRHISSSLLSAPPNDRVPSRPSCASTLCHCPIQGFSEWK